MTQRNPIIRFNYANELKRAGRTDEAVAQYRRALRGGAPMRSTCTSTSPMRCAPRASSKSRKQHYREVLLRDPAHFLGLSKLDSLLRSEGRLEESEDLYRRALELRSHPVTLYNFAGLLRERGDLDAASPDL